MVYYEDHKVNSYLGKIFDVNLVEKKLNRSILHIMKK